MDASNRTALIQRLQECSDDGGNVYLIGVGLGLFASICINIGQNLQAKGLHALNEQQEQQQQQRQHELELEQAARAGGAPQQQPHQQQEPQPQKPKPCESRTWAIGLSIFIFGSLVNFLAFAFAPATVLVALEAVQYVSNVAFNRFVNGAMIACRIYMGVALAVLGTGVVVAFGPQDSAVWTVDDLLHRWTYAIWWIYLIVSSGMCIMCYCVHESYRAAVRRVRRARTSPRQQSTAQKARAVTRAPKLPSGTKATMPVVGEVMPWRREIVMPVTFALYSAQFGSLMVVQSKAINTLFVISSCTGGAVNIFATGYYWATFALLATLGLAWLYKMNEALGLYEPLFIIPLLQAMYITLGAIAGGIFFGEFESMSAPHLALFALGVLTILGGIYLIAPRDADDEREGSFETDLPCSPPRTSCYLSASRPSRECMPTPPPRRPPPTALECMPTPQRQEQQEPGSDSSAASSTLVVPPTRLELGGVRAGTPTCDDCETTPGSKSTAPLSFSSRRPPGLEVIDRPPAMATRSIRPPSKRHPPPPPSPPPSQAQPPKADASRSIFSSRSDVGELYRRGAGGAPAVV